MLCRLLGSYFNSRNNYLKRHLCAQQDSNTDVSKILSEGEAAERRGLSSLAPCDHPNVRGSFAPFAVRGGRRTSPSGLSLALLAFAPRDAATSGAALSPGKLHRGWRNLLLLLSSTCSILPMKSQWYHKKNLYELRRVLLMS